MPLTRIDSAFLDLDAIGGIDFDVNSSVPTLKVEATNHRVGIGHNSPAYKLDVVGDVNISSGSNYLVNGSQISTANVAENSSYLYYTDARAISAVTGSNLDMGSNTITTTGAGSFASLSTGASGVGVNISTGTISGPATLTIDPAAVGDNTGTVVIAGDLQVDGTTTTINSTTLTVDDKNIVLASGAANAAAADGAGITVDTANATLLYKATPDAWSFNKNVGIGTDTPFSRLHVHAPGSDLSTIRLSGTATGQVAYDIRQGIVGVNNAGFSIRDMTNSATRFVISNTGNVGVGEDTPASQVDIKGNVSSTTQFSGFDGLRVHNANGSAFGVTADMYFTAGTGSSNRGAAIGSELVSGYGNDLYFATNAGNVSSTNVLTERLRITSAGNVGINEATPDSKLDILYSSSTNSATENLIHLRTDPGAGYATRGLFVKIGRDGSYDNSGAHYDIVGSAGNSGFHAFEVQGSEKLRINKDGKLILSGTARTTSFISGDGGMCIEQNYDGNLRALSIRNKSTDATAATSMCFSLNRSGGDQDFTAGEIKLEKEQSWTTSSPTVDGAMVFSTILNGVMAEKLRISSDGNLTLGNATYGSSLGQLRIINDASSAPASLALFGHNNTSDGDPFGQIQFAEQESGTGGQIKAKIEAQAVSTNERGSDLVFFTAANTASSSPTEKLRIDSNGRLTLSNSDGIQLSAKTSNLYGTDGSLSYYATNNAVYLNGAGTNGWLRLNAAGAENDQNCINILGGSAGARIEMRTSNLERLRIAPDGQVLINDVSLGNSRTDAPLQIETGGSGNALNLRARSSDDIYSYINFQNNAATQVAAEIYMVRSATNNAGNLVFGTANPNSSIPQQRMVIASSGATTLHVNSASHETFRFTTQALNEAKLIMKDASSNEDVVLNTGGDSWLNGGNVGIGADNPAAKLHINGGAANYTPNSSGSTLFQLSGGASSQYSMYIGIDNDGGYLGHNGANRKLFFQTNESTRMTIGATGNVGIGTDNPTDILHVQTSNTTGQFRLGGNNSGHRIYINSHPTGSYLDSYGSNAYEPFRIDASILSLNGNSGGGVNINRTGTAYAQLDLRQSTGHPAFNIGFPDGSFYRNLGTVGPNDSYGNNASNGGQYLHIRLRTIWNDASMTMFRITGYYSYSSYAESYVGMYRYSNASNRYVPYGQLISNQGNRTTVHSMYNTNADPGYLVIVCDWGTNYVGLMIEHNGAGSSYGGSMQYDVEIIDTKRSTSTSAQW